MGAEGVGPMKEEPPGNGTNLRELGVEYTVGEAKGMGMEGVGI